ncbi:SusC/RagA family TonB-dependent receptor precursor [Tenacibaculum sp. 190524A02b]|uniref:SusC/RagA family TonB-linked outer membrane protein n=1 Tax=Tenacibaculum vairaonense TaxID=3137860 RepID=UPI0032B2A3BA
MENKLTYYLPKGRKTLLVCMRIYILLFCTTLFSFTTKGVLSQNATIVIESDKKITIDQVFELIKNQTDYRFIYQEDMFKSLSKVTLKKGTVTANELLEKSLNLNNYTFKVTANNTVLIKKSKKIQQQFYVSGMITDENKEPLPGANISIQGHKGKGAVSDFDGNYKIMIPNNPKKAVLLFSFMGYAKQEIQVNERNKINVELKPELSSLEEVVVVGYGKKKRKDVTGSISSLSSTVLKTSAATTLGGMIQGQLPGVQVLAGTTQPGTPVRIRIRGDATINSGADPLVVINGVPMPSEFNLNDINPNDVESLDILKGASSTAIYGSRAIAGVIEITTKKGTKYTKPQITYSLTTGIKTLERDLQPLNGTQFKEMWEEGLINYVASRFNVRDGEEAVKNYVHTFSNGFQRNYYEFYKERTEFGDANTPWDDLLIGSAVTQDHYLSLRGGNEAIQYAFSFGRNKEEGMLVGNNLTRNTVSFNYDQKFSSKVKIGFNVSGGTTNIARGGATMANAINMRPDVPAFNEDGSYFVDTYTRRIGPTLWITRARDNPLVLASEVKNDTRRRNVTITPYGEFQLLRNLKFTSRYSYFLSLNENERYYPSYTDHSLLRFSQGIRNESQSESTSSNYTNFISYLNTFNNHDVTAIFGIDFNRRTTESIAEEYSNFADDAIQNQPWLASDYRGGSGNKTESTSIGYYSRVNYKFKNKYLLTASVRVDGSSRFSPANRYGVFPSVALGYIISDESYFSKLKNTISLLKLRLSAGKTGNDNVGVYSWLTEYRSDTNYLDLPGVQPTSLGNDQLKWEESTEYNIGLDFGFLKNNRIRGSIDIYKKNVDNMLVAVPAPPSSGVSSVMQNFGSLTNKGVELNLSGVLVQNEDFNWEVGVNVFKNRNVLTKLGVPRASSNSGGTFLSYYLLEEGKPLGLIYGYKTDGYFQNWEEIDQYEALNTDNKYQETFWNTIPGHLKFVDVSGDGYVSAGNGRDNDPHEDRRVIGDTEPDFSGGIYTNFQYKGLQLNIRGTFQKGGDKYWRYGEYQMLGGLGLGDFLNNADAMVLDRWTPNNPNAKYPVYQQSYYTNKVNDFWVYDASFFKIQEISLSYDLPKAMLEKTNILKQVRVFASLNNVYTFTNYPGYNVESYSTNPIQGSILDNSTYPNERTFRLGVRVFF